MKSLVIFLLALASTTHANSLSMSGENSLTALKELKSNQSIILTDVNLEPLGTVSLNLNRFKVFAPNATVTIHGEQGMSQQSMPNNIYYTGSIEGMKDSRVFIGLLENGQIEGIIESDLGTKYTLKSFQNQLKLSKPSTEGLSQSDNRYFNPKDYLEIPPSEVVKKRAEIK